jgi:serine/threonine protein kinase
MIPSRPPPRLSEPEKWSREFNDFVAQCLTKNAADRPTADDLLKVSFVSKLQFSHCSGRVVLHGGA